MTQHTKSPVKPNAADNPSTTENAAPQQISATPVLPESSPEFAPEFAPEFGGRKGPEATRYGDWEMNGKCVDF